MRRWTARKEVGFGVTMDVHRMKIVYIFVVLLAYFLNRWYRTPDIPDHLLHHDAIFVPELFTKEVADELLDLVREMREFPSNVKDLNFYETLHEHVGEAVPAENGRCDDPLLVPSKDGKMCIFPGRIDIARHFMKYGGFEGKKEKFETSASRLQSFGRYIFDVAAHPVVATLFASDRFLQEARNVCPKHKQVLDPFQFNFIIQVPGQSVALHLDAVYFEDATRFEYPMWLLAVMAHSGLYREKFIDQVQVVGYLHRWNDSSRGGKFVYWLNNSIHPHTEEPLPRAGSFVDGSKVIHASTIYYPNARPPLLDKSAENKLIYSGDDTWSLTSDGKEIRRYKTDDLRITIVYRARCFENSEKQAEFASKRSDKSKSRDVSEILAELKEDMVARFGYNRDYLDSLNAYDLSLELLDNYIKYPKPPSGLIPFNYCLADKLYPWLKPLLRLIC